MSEENDIPWHLLPNKPKEFFGLEDDFTRRDLKRSYNRFLKIFKPEKYPEEFKKIRAAFEVLEENLAYGTPLPQGLITDSFEASEEQTDWEVLIQEQKPEDSKPDKEEVKDPFTKEDPFAEKDPFAEDDEFEVIVQEQANLKNSDEIISIINSENVKLPEKYLYGAFIKEIEEGEESFLKFLLEGHKTFPDDYRLNSALEKYCRSKNRQLSADRIISMLDEALSSRFFQISERVWFDFFKEHGFSSFQRKLGLCKNSRSYNDPHELCVFNVRMCRKFFFRLDFDWVKEKIFEAEEYYEALSYDIQSDIDFVLNLMEYHEIKEEFRSNDHQYCRNLHNLIVDWCELESTEATKKALAFLSEQPHIISLKSFNSKDNKYVAFWRVFNSIVTDLEYEIDWSNNQYDDEEKEMKVREFLLELEKKTEKSFMGSLFPFTYFLFLSIHLAVILLPAFIIGFNGWHPANDILKWVIYILTSAVTGFAYWKLLEKYPVLLMDFITEWPKYRVYDKTWRSEVAEFIKDSGITYHELEWISTYMENKSGIAYDGDLRECMDTDLGIKVYSAGMQFQ